MTTPHPTAIAAAKCIRSWPEMFQNELAEFIDRECRVTATVAALRALFAEVESLRGDLDSRCGVSTDPPWVDEPPVAAARKLLAELEKGTTL